MLKIATGIYTIRKLKILQIQLKKYYLNRSKLKINTMHVPITHYISKALRTTCKFNFRIC